MLPDNNLAYGYREQDDRQFRRIQPEKEIKTTSQTCDKW